jgi:hypothetical protein
MTAFSFQLSSLLSFLHGQGSISLTSIPLKYPAQISLIAPREEVEVLPFVRGDSEGFTQQSISSV